MSRDTDHLTFGTDGWRAVIGDTYTFYNVARVALGTSRWLINTHKQDFRVAIGHDARFLGREFAEHAARVFATYGGPGVQVLFADGITPTPAVSWATRQYECDAGIVLTASHNPFQYNGFKLKGPYGGSALPEMVAAVEREVPDDLTGIGMLSSFEDAVADGRISLEPMTDAYLDSIRAKIDLDSIRAAGLRVAHDAMFGAGRGLFSTLLGPDAVLELHSTFNPSFEGRPPEPIEKNLPELARIVVSEGCAAGIANDGDADRIGMFDEKGRFVDSHRLLALLVRYLHEDKGMSGDLVKTCSTTDMLDDMAAVYNLPLHTTPIGFKYIGGYMLDNDVLVGGEESGGMAVKGHIPERDGIYIGLLILEMMAHRGKYLSALVDDLFRDFGPRGYHRVDIHTSEEAMDKALIRLRKDGGLSSIAGQSVESVDMLDGFKHRLSNGWLLVRPSGTEPVLRIYSESDSDVHARAFVNDTVLQLGLT